MNDTVVETKSTVHALRHPTDGRGRALEART
jgi:hypothetical protein